MTPISAKLSPDRPVFVLASAIAVPETRTFLTPNVFILALMGMTPRPRAPDWQTTNGDGLPHKMNSIVRFKVGATSRATASEARTELSQISEIGLVWSFVTRVCGKITFTSACYSWWAIPRACANDFNRCGEVVSHFVAHTLFRQPATCVQDRFGAKTGPPLA